MPLQTADLLAFEREFRLKGFRRIAGVDEVGRGCLAGPVVACACVIPKGLFIEGVNDSKKLTPTVRRRLFNELIAAGVSYGIGSVEPEVIDEINIYQATLLAMQQAVLQINPLPDLLLVDGMPLKSLNIPSEKIIGGDARVFAIAAASILAKETRDDLMRVYHARYPDYGFDNHKGYGTPQHLRAIKEHGITPIHRRSFAPCT